MALRKSALALDLADRGIPAAAGDFVISGFEVWQLQHVIVPPVLIALLRDEGRTESSMLPPDIVWHHLRAQARRQSRRPAAVEMRTCGVQTTENGPAKLVLEAQLDGS